MDTPRAAVRERLELEIASILRDCPAPHMEVPCGQLMDKMSNNPAEPEPVVLVEQGSEMVMREPFGRWLLAQKDRGDWIDNLATAARADRGFPRDATPDQVRGRLQLLGADGDAFEQVDDAERCWLSC
ncbi:hypothetical protein [uncultured Sphingomonas sp.]|uniref:hypothetical protein n=1 Tax=uncultured Sphingomonas sp. TaxID=158754 RepID=UPI0025CE2284|nr:hypothetical protein [uncultured Sphingomonas sp.]